jgi:hypothetical protein
MSRMSSQNALVLAERLYRTLLFVYPETHRREYGPLMVQLFRDLCRDFYRQRGFAGLVQLWIRVLTDTAVAAPTEHLYALREGGQLMTKRQHWMVLALAGLPLELGVLLYTINPAFMGQLFAPGAAQPVGWIMVTAVFLLMGTAYLVQRRIIVLSQLSGSSSQIPPGRASRIAWSVLLGPFRSIALSGHRGKGLLFACSVLLLVCPATLLVLLGPAVITVLRAGLYP